MTLRTVAVDEAEIAKVPTLLVSADSHVDEPRELWTRLPTHMQEKIPKPRPLNKRPAGGTDPKARIVDMDTDGVKAEVLYPTFSLAWFALDQAFQEAAFRLYNDWLAEYCATSPKRLFGIATLCTYDIDQAIGELRRAHDMGHIGALIWQVPDPAIPFTSMHYERLWAAASEMNMPINLHILTGHNYSRRDAHGIEHVRGSVNHKTNDAVNTVYDFVWSGVFDRHPKLKVELVEAEIGWLPFMLQQWDYYYHRFNAPGPQHQDFPISRPPSEIFNEHFYCTFMDDFVGSRLLDFWGERNCMWSSDYPHGNMTWPLSRAFVAKQLGYLSDAKKKRLLSQNVIDLYGLKL